VRADLREGDVALRRPGRPLLGELWRGREVTAGRRGVHPDQHRLRIGTTDVVRREDRGEASHLEVARLDPAAGDVDEVGAATPGGLTEGLARERAERPDEREGEHHTENPGREAEGLDKEAPALDGHLPATREVLYEHLTLSLGRCEAVRDSENGPLGIRYLPQITIP